MLYKLPYADGDLPSPSNQPGISDMAVAMLILDPATGKPTSPGGGAGGAVKIDPLGNTVKLDPLGSSVKLDVTANTIKIDAAANTVKTNDAVLGVSLGGAVPVAPAAIIAAGAFKKHVTILNNHATINMSISFAAAGGPAAITLIPGASITLPFGPTNAISGQAEGAAPGTFVAIGA